MARFLTLSQRHSYVTLLALAGLVAACDDPLPSIRSIVIDVPGPLVAVGAVGGVSWLDVRGRAPFSGDMGRVTFQVDGGPEVDVALDPVPGATGAFAVKIDGLTLGPHVVTFRGRHDDGALVTASIDVRVVPAIREVPLPPSAASGGAFPTAINNHGEVTGYFLDNNAPAFHAFVVRNGQSRALAEPGSWRSVATGLNDAGDVVGYVIGEPYTTPAARVWTGDSSTTLLQQPGVASAINDAGVVTGTVYRDGFDHPPRGFVRRNGVVTVFGEANRFTGGASVNAAGDVVGTSIGQSDITPFLYRNGHLAPVKTLGGMRAYARAINDAGVVVGFSEPPDRLTYHAFRARNGSAVALRRDDRTDVASFAYRVNARGVVVGEYITPGEEEGQYWAFLATGDTLVAIEHLIGAGAPQMLAAYDINVRGEIVVAAVVANEVRPLIVAIPGGPEARRTPPGAADTGGSRPVHSASIGRAVEEHRARVYP